MEKYIEGTDNRYIIDDEGYVFDTKYNIISTTSPSNRVTLAYPDGTHHSYKLDKLIYEYFGELPSDYNRDTSKYYMVRHLDGKESNNEISNLKLITRSEWQKEYGYKSKFKTNGRAASVPIALYREENLSHKFKSISEAARYLKENYLSDVDTKISSIKKQLSDAINNPSTSNTYLGFVVKKISLKEYKSK